MNHRPDVPPEGGTSNRVADDVFGSLVQAGVINGNVHLRETLPERPLYEEARF
ncbi:hypothetical protein ACIOD2_47165 [Amycolatopsis sp. NPDC088138]|uniref:hypothetical protein n=1 Tax=Amycolatopsis sp. NPDC088138 TaxID=3363938 RepID=UPI00382764DE